jgi:hypothetical protein
MNQWTMINVLYSRLPEKQVYNSTIGVDEVSLKEEASGPELVVREILREMLLDTPLEVIVERVHDLLQLYPEAKVSMVQELTRPGVYRRRGGHGFELDKSTVDLIKNDLDRAKRLFAPLEQTVRTTVTAPKVELKPQA